MHVLTQPFYLSSIKTVTTVHWFVHLSRSGGTYTTSFKLEEFRFLGAGVLVENATPSEHLIISHIVTALINYIYFIK